MALLMLLITTLFIMDVPAIEDITWLLKKRIFCMIMSDTCTEWQVLITTQIQATVSTHYD